MKEINESDIMNVSAPVKISQYISSSKAKFERKKNSHQSNIFVSNSPHNKVKKDSIAFKHKMDFNKTVKAETPKNLQGTVDSITKAMKIAHKVQEK